MKGRKDEQLELFGHSSIRRMGCTIGNDNRYMGDSKSTSEDNNYYLSDVIGYIFNVYKILEKVNQYVESLCKRYNQIMEWVNGQDE